MNMLKTNAERSIFMVEFGEKLKQIREEKGMTAPL